MDREEKVQWLAQQEAVLQTVYAKLFTEVTKLQIEEAYLQRKIHALIEAMLSQTSDKAAVAQLVQELEEAHDPDFSLFPKQEKLEETAETKLEEHFGSNDTELFAFKM